MAILRNAWDDIGSSLRDWRIWLHLSVLDIQNRYRRTFLGPLWAVISAFILILALGLVYSILWGSDVSNFLPYFSAGYICWIFITTSINESTLGFISQAILIRAAPIALSAQIYRVVSRKFLIFLHMVPVHVLMLLYFQKSFSVSALVLLLIGFTLVLVLLFLVGTVLAIATTRYRDISQLISSTLQLFFFVTPIIWTPDQLISNDLAYFLASQVNPFYHMIDVIRAPLLGTTPSALTYYYLLVAIAISGALAFVIMGKYKNRIVFWV